MDQVKKKVAEEMRKSMMEESQEQLSTAEPEESEAAEDASLQTQAGTEEAPNTAGSKRCFSVWRREKIPARFAVILQASPVNRKNTCLMRRLKSG